MSNVLTLKNVGFAYRGRPVINDLDAIVSHGEFLGIAGPNGAGKSTLLRLMGGFLRPAHGAVELLEHPIASYSRAALARQLAFVGQNVATELPFTVEDLVSMGRYPHLKPLQPFGPDDTAAVEAALQETGLAERRYQRLLELSAGERQMALLARAIAQQAPLLLLDEPTAFLDMRHGADLLRTLRRLRRDGAAPQTVVMVCHDLNLLARCADRILLINKGIITASGRPEEILRAPILEPVFGCTLDIRPLIQPVI